MSHTVALTPCTNATFTAIAGAGINPFMRNLTTNIRFAIDSGDRRPGARGQNGGGETCCDQLSHD